MPRCYRQRWSCAAEQLLAHFIHTDLPIAGIVGSDVDRQHILHTGYKVRIGFGGETPLLFQPGLELVFLSTCRTVS